MRRGLSHVALLLLAVATPSGATAAPPTDTRGWLGEELPLPLAVRTSQDLAVKAAAAKQYLIFNLLAGGKLAGGGGDYATAATKWEALLRIHGLDPEIDKVIRPLAKDARSRAGGSPGTPIPPVATAAPEAIGTPAAPVGAESAPRPT